MEAERKRVASEERSKGAAEAEKIKADADRQRTVVLAEAYRDAQNIKGSGDAQANELTPKYLAKIRSLRSSTVHWMLIASPSINLRT